jgi:hypothetical protein
MKRALVVALVFEVQAYAYEEIANRLVRAKRVVTKILSIAEESTNRVGCGSSPTVLNANQIDHLTLLSRGFGAGRGSGTFPSS